LDEPEIDPNIVQFEGYLFKMTDTKRLKKLWFKLLHRDLYYYKYTTDITHKGMHNLTGVFVKEENKETVEGVE